MRRQRLSKADKARSRERLQRLSPEQRATIVVIGFISAIIGLALEAVWLSWIGVIAVRVVRRRRSGMAKAVKQSVRLSDLAGIAVIQIVFWRFRGLLRDVVFVRPAAEDNES